MNTLGKWLISIRAFALSASTMPILFGTALAVVVGGAHLNIPRFLLALVGMMALHSGANMLNDVFDYRKGLDKQPTPVSGAVVRGLLTDKQVLAGGIALMLLGSAIGVLLAWMVGPTILTLGIVGVAIGFFYTAGPIELKYHGLGDLAVFLDFGVLGSLGAWIVQTAHFSWIPALWAVPMSLYVIGILHANNWRDIGSDSGLSVVTVASLLGDRGSLIYYGFLLFTPFLFVTALVVLHFLSPGSTLGMPPALLLTWLALPLALQRWKRAVNRAAPAQPTDFIALDGATAQLNLVFGLLCSVAVVIHGII